MNIMQVCDISGLLFTEHLLMWVCFKELHIQVYYSGDTQTIQVMSAHPAKKSI